MTARPVVLAIAAAGILAVPACNRSQPDVAAFSAPPPVTTEIGPVPGPEPSQKGASNPHAGDLASMSEGRELFVRMNCSGCHGGRAGGGMAPSLRDEDWLYGNTDEQLFSSVAEGRSNGMPSWGTKLTADQIWKIVTYVKSLRTENEPQRPVERGQ